MAALRASGVRAAVLLRPGLARPPPAAGYHEKVGRAGEGRRETRRPGAPDGLQLPSVPITGVAAPPLESAELSKDGLQNAGAGKADTRQARGWWEGSEDPRLGLMGREGDGLPQGRREEAGPGAVMWFPDGRRRKGGSARGCAFSSFSLLCRLFLESSNARLAKSKRLGIGWA